MHFRLLTIISTESRINNNYILILNVCFVLRYCLPTLLLGELSSEAMQLPQEILLANEGTSFPETLCCLNDPN